MLLDDEKREPFRFSTSPSTPRETTPTFGGITASVSAPANGEPRKPRLLAKNPNGVYRWRGGGSSRPRNRYQSPGFGLSQSQPTRLKLSPENPVTDTKRRRVGEDAQSSTSQRVAMPPRAAHPAPANGMSSSSGANGTTSAPFPAKSPSPTRQAPAATANGLAPPATPRLRTTGMNKPTAPAVPSPLRQTWSQGDSSPPSVKPTRAANVMTELIKEVTPPKKPAFTNPYEAQYPGSLKNLPKRTAPARKRKSREDAKAAAAKPADVASQEKTEEKQEKEVEMSPRKIIEATVPKVTSLHYIVECCTDRHIGC